MENFAKFEFYEIRQNSFYLSCRHLFMCGTLFYCHFKVTKKILKKEENVFKKKLNYAL